MWTTFISFWDDLLDPLKVTFDGDNKLIIINPQYSTINMKIDVYSAYKRWFQRRQNCNYLRPLRGIGGDTIAGGLYAGDIYFLTNNWQIVTDHLVSLTGIVYSDNVNLNPFIIKSGGGLISTVSNLAYSYNTVGTTVPSTTDIANQVWNTSPSSFGANTAGSKLQKIDSIQNTTTNILAVTG